MSGFCHRTLGHRVSWYVPSFGCVHPGQLGPGPAHGPWRCLVAEGPAGPAGVAVAEPALDREHSTVIARPNFQQELGCSREQISAGLVWPNRMQLERLFMAPLSPRPADGVVAWLTWDCCFPRGRVSCSRYGCAVCRYLPVTTLGVGHCPQATGDCGWDADSGSTTKHRAV